MQNEYYGLASTPTEDYLAHYGIKGMKWGVRRAIQSGNDRALSRQYRKAQKKLEKLERRAENGRKYAKRAARLGVGAAAAGGLAAAGTKGVGNLINEGGSLARSAMLSGGKALQGVGAGISRFGAAHGNKKLQAIGGQMSSAGLRSQSAADKTAVDAGVAANAVKKWGNSDSLSKKAIAAGGGADNKYTRALTGMSNNTIARIGAGAIGAGLAGAAGYNAYRAATTKKAADKAAAFRKEMNKQFAGTRYASTGAARSKKRRTGRA